jgi:hypothetical protein
MEESKSSEGTHDEEKVSHIHKYRIYSDKPRLVFEGISF